MTSIDRPLWTEEKLALAEGLWKEGHNAAFVAERCGTTRNAIIGQVHRRGWLRTGEVKVAKPPPKEKVHKPIVARPRAIRPVPAADPGKVRLVDLTLHTCRWPVDGDGAATLFCGQEIDDHSVYCLKHHRLATGQSYAPRVTAKVIAGRLPR